MTYAKAARPKGFITLSGVGHGLNTGSEPILRDSSLGFFSRFVRGRPGGLKRVEKAAADSNVARLVKAW